MRASSPNTRPVNPRSSTKYPPVRSTFPGAEMAVDVGALIEVRCFAELCGADGRGVVWDSWNESGPGICFKLVWLTCWEDRQTVLSLWACELCYAWRGRGSSRVVNEKMEVRIWSSAPVG